MREKWLSILLHLGPCHYIIRFMTEARTRMSEIVDRYPQIGEVMEWFVFTDINDASHGGQLAIIARESLYHHYYSRALQAGQVTISGEDLMGKARAIIEEVAMMSEGESEYKEAAKAALSGDVYSASGSLEGKDRKIYFQTSAVAEFAQAVLNEEEPKRPHSILVGTWDLAIAIVEAAGKARN